jgi:hypothetical protein
MQSAHTLGSGTLSRQDTSAISGSGGAKADLSKRMEKTIESERVHRAKCRICHVLGTLSNIRTDFRISLLLDHFKKALQNGHSLAGHATYDSKETGDEASGEFVPLDEPGSEGRRMKNIRPPTLEVEGVSLDFSFTKLASLAENAANKVESIGEHIGDLLVKPMGKTIDGKSGEWALTQTALDILDGGSNDDGDRKGLFGELTSKLDISKMGGGRTDLVTACIDLLMYDSAELFDMAFCTLTNNFRQERNFLRALENTQLLVSKESVAVYTRLQSELSYFRHHIQSYELWGVTSQFNNEVDMGKVASVKRMLTWMRCECTTEGGTIDGSLPVTENQILLGNLGVHMVVLECLEIDAEKPAHSLDKHLLEIKELCCKFLEKFVMGNTCNQDRLFPFLEEKFMPLCSSGLGIAPAIASLFVDNRLNCAYLTTSPHILQQFGQALKEGGAGAPTGLDLLDCFGKLIAPNGLPLAENQSAILRVMTSKEWNSSDPREALCMTLISNAETDGEEESSAAKIASEYRKELMLHFDSSLITRSGDLHPAMAHAAEGTDTTRLLYHVKVLNLLTQICVGKSPTTEIKCQQLLPLPALLEVVTDVSSTANESAYGIAGFLVKSAVLDLIREVYFETGISAYDSLGKDERTWSLIRVLTEDLLRFTQLQTKAKAASTRDLDAIDNPMSAGGGESSDFAGSVREKMIFEAVLPVLASFCDNYLPATKYSNNMDKAGRELARKLSPAHYSTLRMLQDAIEGLTRSGVWGEGSPRLLSLIRCGVAARKYAMSDLEQLDKNALGDSGRAASEAQAQDHSETNAAGALKDLCRALHNSYEFQFRIEDEFARFVETVEDIKNLTDPEKALERDLNEKKAKADAEGGILGNIRITAKRDSVFDVAGHSKSSKGCTITMERLICRMVTHLRGQMSGNLVRLGNVRGHSMGEGNADIMELMARIIQNHEGFTEARIKELKPTDEEIEERAAGYVTIQDKFDSWGVTEMAIDVISHSKDPATIIGAMELLIELLTGGNITVQSTIFNYLTEHRNSEFFAAMRDRIRGAATAAKLKRKIAKARKLAAKQGMVSMAEEDEENVFDPIRMDLVGNVLQLFAEGHNHDMQDLMRDQLQFKFQESSNLINEAVKLLAVVAKNEQVIVQMLDGDAEDMGKVLEFLIEVMQGPCRKNQELLVASPMVDVCKRIIISKMRYLQDDPEEESETHTECSREKDVKGKATTALASLLEGRADERVHRQLSKKLEVSILRERLVEIHQGYEQIEEAQRTNNHKLLSNMDYEDGDLDCLLGQGFDLLTMANGLEHCWRTSGKTNSGADWKEWGKGQFNVLPMPDASSYGEGVTAQRQFEMAKRKFDEKAAYQKAYSFFDDDLRSIEIVWDGQLERVFFPKPKECNFLTSSLRESFMGDIDYCDEDKVRDLLKKAEELGETLLHYENLNSNSIYRMLGTRVEELKHWSFALALMMNFIMLISLQRGTSYVSSASDEPFYEPAYMEQVQFSLGILQVITAALVLIFLLLNRAPLVYKKLVRESRRLELTLGIGNMSAGKLFKSIQGVVLKVLTSFQLLITWLAIFGIIFAIFYARFAENEGMSFSSATAIVFLLLITLGTGGLRKWWSNPDNPLAFNYCCVYDVVMAPNTLFYVLYVICALLGVVAKIQFAYCYHLLDLVMMNQDLQNVVKSVSGPWKQLGMTTVLGVFVIYIFSLVGFYVFDDFYNAETGTDECGTMIRCFFTFLHNGLLPGGGIADYISFELGYQPFQTGQTWWSTWQYTFRTIYDLLYFIAVTVLLLNIIFGIILDEFSKLREEKAERDDLMTNFCFVCELEKGDFDDEASKRKPPQSGGFARHIGSEHNMWDYVFYLIYLQKKDSTEFTGAETYVEKQLLKDSIDWLPRKRAMCMDHSDTLSLEDQISMSAKRTQRLTEAKVGSVVDTVRELRRQIDDMDARVDGNITSRNRMQNSRAAA